jgi:phosphoglycerate dehydrogenase-like enzyme
MTTRVFSSFLGDQTREVVAATDLDVEVVDITPDGPADGVSAEVLFGFAGVVDDKVLRRHLDAGVRWIQLAGTGIDGVPSFFYDEDRIVTNVPGASAVPIAEFVLGAMLVFEKRFGEVWLSEPPPHWNFAPLGGLAGKTVGIVGFGGIGQAIARRAIAFDTTVLALRRTDRPSEVPGVTLVASLDELLAVSDHLVLAVPLTPRTQNLLDAAAFEKMKPGLHLVNIARGGLVDQDALRSALDDGRVAIATLDTVTPEPLAAGHWLYEHPKVRLSAHVSWFSPSGLRRPVEMFVENLGRYMRGESLQWIVDRNEGY